MRRRRVGAPGRRAQGLYRNGIVMFASTDCPI